MTTIFKNKLDFIGCMTGHKRIKLPKLPPKQELRKHYGGDVQEFLKAGQSIS